MSGAVQSVATALEDVARWKADESAKQQGELVEVDNEIQSLEKAIENLQTQLEALKKFRGELQARGDTLGDAEITRSYESIFAALTSQQAATATRIQAHAEAESQRKAHEKSTSTHWYLNPGRHSAPS